MNKFWEWMIKKGYAYDKYMLLHVSTCDPTKQMLIGYMIEYLFSSSDDINCLEDIFPCGYDYTDKPEEFYSQLEKMITESV